MATIAEQLTSLSNTKAAIKQSIIDKGVAVADTDPFSAYPAKIGQISGGSAPATKYGVSIDNLFGDVDANGELQFPTAPFVFNGLGIKSICPGGLGYRFASAGGGTKNYPVTKILLPDLESINDYGCIKLAPNVFSLVEVDLGKISSVLGAQAFDEAFASCANLTTLSAPNLTELGGQYCCRSMFEYSGMRSTGLPNLTTISGVYACQHMYRGCTFDELGLPNLTTISGASACQYMFNSLNIDVAEFPKLATITGSAACQNMFTFSTVKKVYFPALTTVDVDAFGWSVSAGAFSSCEQLTEIHFRADAQATIEAMSVYADKWGATSSTIYFDLIGTITVNGVAYSRDEQNSIRVDGAKTFVAWKDASNNIVYTNATSEPAVGTPVYSDAGTTQVGTVSEVA